LGTRASWQSATKHMCTTFHVWNVTLEYLSNVSWSYRSQTIFFSQYDSLPEERMAFSKRKLSSCFHWLCLWREHVIESNRTLRRRRCKVRMTVLCAVQYSKWISKLLRNKNVAVATCCVNSVIITSVLV